MEGTSHSIDEVHELKTSRTGQEIAKSRCGLGRLVRGGKLPMAVLDIIDDSSKEG